MANVSNLGQALGLIENLKKQQLKFADLTTQLATGKKTQRFSGLESDVLVSKRSRANLVSIDNYTNNMKIADRRINQMSSAIGSFKKQANNFKNALLNFSQQSAHQLGSIVYWDDPATPDDVEAIAVGYDTADPDVDLRALQDLAGNVYDFLVDLVNTQDGDRYIFGGAESLLKPLEDSGTMDSAISTMLKGWRDGTITNDDLVANFKDRTVSTGNTDALVDSVVGYNSTLGSGNAKDVTVRVSSNSEIDYTVLGNDKSFRDILTIVSLIKNADLGPIADEVEIDDATGLPVVITQGAPGATVDEMKDNFFKVINDLSVVLKQAVDGLDQLSFGIENTRARLNTLQRSYENDKALLQSTVDDVENVDLNEVALSINTLQVQLDASYRVTARLQELSLVNFL